MEKTKVLNMCTSATIFTFAGIDVLELSVKTELRCTADIVGSYPDNVQAVRNTIVQNNFAINYTIGGLQDIGVNDSSSHVVDI